LFRTKKELENIQYLELDEEEAKLKKEYVESLNIITNDMFDWIKNKKTVEVNFWKFYSRMKGEIHFDEYNKIECTIISVSRDIIEIQKPDSKTTVKFKFKIDPNRKMWFCGKDYIEYVETNDLEF
jgi:hypothetical protein